MSNNSSRLLQETNELWNVVRQALVEDIGAGDITTISIVPEGILSSATFVAKEEGILAGWDAVETVFRILDPSMILEARVADGERAASGQAIATLHCSASALLTGERTALNLLQRMSGIATSARAYVDAVSGTKSIILDTRKTVPGLRFLDKRAVKIGGAQNHRFGLFDMGLIKENHIAVAGGIKEAMKRFREQHAMRFPVEIEVRNLSDLRDAVALRPDRILLDNMPVDTIQESVAMVGGEIPLEASGNVTLKNVRAIAETGVDFISVGELTHSVQAMDISLLVNTNA